MLEDLGIFKDFESAAEGRLTPRGISVLRLDGSNFSRFTQQFNKPFSDIFEVGMNAAALAVRTHVLPKSLITYVGSDEISFIYSDAFVALPYGGRRSKILSLAASHAGLGFMSAVPQAKGSPAFDARLFELPDSSLIREYITWRRLDTRKNAISMAAGHLHSHKKLLGVSTPERAQLLVGTPFELIAEETFNGRFFVPEKFVAATQKRAEKLTSRAAEVHETHLTMNKSELR